MGDRIAEYSYWIMFAHLGWVPVVFPLIVVTRGVMNAFRAVVNDHDNARETLRWYNKDINKEITRKRQNLGIDDTDSE